MNTFAKSACLALALASVIGVAAADDHVQAGQQVFEWRCRNCHGGTAPADYSDRPESGRHHGQSGGKQSYGDALAPNPGFRNRMGPRVAAPLRRA